MGTMLAFYSLAEAQRWWSERHPGDPPLQEAPRCARCGAYFGPSAEATALIATDSFPSAAGKDGASTSSSLPPSFQNRDRRDSS